MLARGEKTQEKIQIKRTADQNDTLTDVMWLLCEEMSFLKANAGSCIDSLRNKYTTFSKWMKLVHDVQEMSKQLPSWSVCFYHIVGC